MARTPRVAVMSPAQRDEPAAPTLGTNWARVRSALLRYSWLIVLVTAVSAGAGILASHLLAPVYTAQATIWIDQSDRRGNATGGPMRTSEVFGAEAWADLLRSYAVLEPVAQKLHLDRAFAPRVNGQIVSYTPHDAATKLRDALHPHIDQEGNFLTVELTDTDPVRLAATLNAIASEYVTVAATMKKQKVTDLTALLSTQVAYATSNLAASEQALQSFRTRNATAPGDMTLARGGTGPNSYDDLLARRDVAWRQRTEMEQLLSSSPDSMMSDGELESLAAAAPTGELSQILKELSAKRADLRQLRMKYSDQYPAVKQAKADITSLEHGALIPQALGILTQMRRQEAVLTGRLDTMVTSLRSVPARDLEEARLRRNVTLAEALYNTLQQRYSEAQLTNASSVSDLRVLDRAAPPETPTKNVAPRIIAMATFGGLIFACVLAVLLDRADKRFRYPDQVSRGLGLTILGSVPHVKAPDKKKTPREQAPFLEAMRDLRLNVAYAHAETGPVAFTITSPGSSDGKSFLSMHIARVFAESGQRTILIDGDLRRGALHKQFAGTSRLPGITEYLRGEATVDAIVQHTHVPRVDIISCGARTGTAPELLGSPAMTELLAELRTRYDAIICDSPPLGAGIDAVVLSAVTGSMLLVVRAGVSEREVAESRLDVMSRLPVRMLGAVLNDVPDNSSYRYYSHYHMSGYEAADEATSQPQRVLAGKV